MSLESDRSNNGLVKKQKLAAALYNQMSVDGVDLSSKNINKCSRYHQSKPALYTYSSISELFCCYLLHVSAQMYHCQGVQYKTTQATEVQRNNGARLRIISVMEKQ